MAKISNSSDAKVRSFLSHETEIPTSKLHMQPAIGDDDEESPIVTSTAQKTHAHRHLEIARSRRKEAMTYPAGSDERYELLYAASLHADVADSGRLNATGLLRPAG